MSHDEAQAPVTEVRNHWWWRPGWRSDRTFYTWHLTFDRQHELHNLVEAYQEALRAVAGLDLIPLRWLHLTIQGVGFTDEVKVDEIRAIADVARQLLSGLPPQEITFSQAVVRPEALALIPRPVEALVSIRRTIRNAIAEVWGHTAVPEAEDRFEPHVSIAYVNADGPARPALDALASVTPRPVHLTVAEASLIVLRRGDHVYQWDTFARAPLVR